MGQETPGIQKPDCPYPAFEDVTIRDIEQGTILSLRTLIDYLYYVRTQELMMPLGPGTNPTLAQACELIIRLLTRHFPLASELTPRFVYTYNEIGYIYSSPYILSYRNPDFPSLDLCEYDSVAYWHGGIVGLNQAHWEIFAMLALFTQQNNYGIIIGLERNEYLATKGRDMLRPWELIVTVSIFCHLARIYGIPLKVFIMPPFPGQDADLNQHYMDVYKRVLCGNPKTPIVMTLRDKYRLVKIERMEAVGLKPADWEWTDLTTPIISPSTRLIIRDRLLKFSNLTISDWRIFKVPIASVIFLWEDVYLWSIIQSALI